MFTTEPLDFLYQKHFYVDSQSMYCGMIKPHIMSCWKETHNVSPFKQVDRAQFYLFGQPCTYLLTWFVCGCICSVLLASQDILFTLAKETKSRCAIAVFIPSIFPWFPTPFSRTCWNWKSERNHENVIFSYCQIFCLV